ncbi:MAG: AAA family ATPase [Acidimicrobiales bacterium]
MSSAGAYDAVMAGLGKVEIEGFKSIRSATVELERVNVLVGANGSGKSNFLDALDLVGEMINQHLGMAVGRAGGADRLLFNGAKVTERIRFDMSFGQNRYEAVLAPAAGGLLYFEKETCWGQGYKYSEPFRAPLGVGHSESNLPAEAQDPSHTIAQWTLSTMRQWRRFHFHDTSAAARVRQPGPINDNRLLERDGGNLAAFLFGLEQSRPAAYGRIVAAVRLAAPFFAEFLLAPDVNNENLIRLEWRATDSDAYADATSLSDGTLRFMCLVTLLLQPDPPSLIFIDEPELGLHPFAMVQLADLVRAAPSETQLILSTQSTTLLNQFDVCDIVVVNRADGASTFERLDAADLMGWLEDYAVGELWEKNVLGGRPRHA